ncbi:signal transduction histidine kinase [Devosia subaequoris]|uniref:histidine kinase n=1 Tax=Devosia subaequoris TaxID=395930 RepID=A0A7W6IRP1_9HYPH|nr:HAMP domain-containing sensor histidine kinase [Devosia subaequoris]MBB4054022.1 signal transduction histidine kinase [Devosia subaequoris]MCP1211554.1 HAMP domain-containing histidine kinase [Devosia subaequoris]
MDFDTLSGHVFRVSGRVPWKCTDDGVIVEVGRSDWSLQPGTVWKDAAHPADIHRELPKWKLAAREMASYSGSLRIRTTRSFRWCYLEAFPALEADGARAWYGFLSHCDDVQLPPSLPESQMRFRQMENISAMGAMASVITHELNQPMLAISQYAGGLKQLLEDDDFDLAEVRDGVNSLQEGAERAGEILRRVRELVRRGAVQRENVSVFELLRTTVSLVQHIFGLSINPAITVAKDLPPVYADPVQIQQVLINLIRNAFEASEAPPKIKITATLFSSDCCEVAVVDEGPGIAAGDDTNLFQPFASSKTNGMGIGLSICRSVVEAHNGRIWYEPAIGGGTAIKFTLPIAQEDVNSSSARTLAG